MPREPLRKAIQSLIRDAQLPKHNQRSPLTGTQANPNLNRHSSIKPTYKTPNLKIILSVAVGVGVGLYLYPKSSALLSILKPAVKVTDNTTHITGDVDPRVIDSDVQDSELLEEERYPSDIEAYLRVALASLHSTKTPPDPAVVLKNMTTAWHLAQTVEPWGENPAQWWRTVSGIGIRLASIYESGIVWRVPQTGVEEVKMERDLVQSLLILGEVKEFLMRLDFDEENVIELREGALRLVRLGMKCSKIRFELYNESEVSNEVRKEPLKGLFPARDNSDIDGVAEIKTMYLRMALHESRTSLNTWLNLLQTDPKFKSKAWAAHAARITSGESYSSEQVDYLPEWVDKNELAESFMQGAEIADAANVFPEAMGGYALGLAISNDFRTKILAWTRLVSIMTRPRELRIYAPEEVARHFERTHLHAEAILPNVNRWWKAIENAMKKVENLKEKKDGYDEETEEKMKEVWEDRFTCASVAGSLYYSMAILALELKEPKQNIERNVNMARKWCGIIKNVDCLRAVEDFKRTSLKNYKEPPEGFDLKDSQGQ